MDVIDIRYKGLSIAALSHKEGETVSRFEYTKDAIDLGIEFSPIKMPLKENQIYSFIALNEETFKAMPGLVADSLPDDFGNAVLDEWLVNQTARTTPLSPLERLQYTGTRGMGALEYFPQHQSIRQAPVADISVQTLTELAQSVLDSRNGFAQDTYFTEAHNDPDMMKQMLLVGTSAGGARPKAVLAFDKTFSNVRSGQGDVPDEFTHYLLKFDGVQERDPAKQTFGDPLGYSAMEYVYHLMANRSELGAGIAMEPCLLLPEGHRRHFLTKRFDRIGNEKVHVQTLCAMDHVNYNEPGSYSYEQIFATMRKLKPPKEDAIQLLRRMVFNLVATNHDDHAKNFSFMIDADGKWRLSPAYDVAYSFNPSSEWTKQHWMRLNGKRRGHTRKDIYALTDKHLPKFSRALIDENVDCVIEAVSQWDRLALEHGVPEKLRSLISKNLKLTQFT